MKINKNVLSDNHLVKTNKGYVAVNKLKKDDSIIDMNGQTIKILKIHKPKAKKRIKNKKYTVIYLQRINTVSPPMTFIDIIETNDLKYYIKEHYNWSNIIDIFDGHCQSTKDKR